jgi:tRNA (adenine58-N1)-methyltransferase non-catalytic subunit
VRRTISLGRYINFPSNLIIHRPYHLTYELLEKRPDENFCRLRVVPASELHASVLAEEESSSREESTGLEDSDRIITPNDGVEYSLVDVESDAVVARSNHESIDYTARQTLTSEEIEKLKQDGSGAGKDLIAKLLLSHTAIDQKTAFSLSKYKLLKAKKFLRRFSPLPLDVQLLQTFLLEEKNEGNRTLELREELTALLGCWGNVYFGGKDTFLDAKVLADDVQPDIQLPKDFGLKGGRYLVADDTGGLLVAALAERMGILYPPTEGLADDSSSDGSSGTKRKFDDSTDDFEIPYSLTNTITVLGAHSQPNLTFLNYYGYDCANPNHPPHILNEHLLFLTWLQLLDPAQDSVYASPVPTAPSETLESWKAGRRGAYHRKRRRWVRLRHTVDSTRAGGFSGLIVASSMDPISIVRHTLPLLANGAPIAIYSPSLEPLTALADCFSIARRAAWGGVEPPPEIVGKTATELEHWQGSDDFPLNPSLVLGATVQTSRVRKWQVLPGRTHPVMNSRGGAEGYVFTGWKAVPAEGRVAARGKYTKNRIVAVSAAVDVPDTMDEL